MPISAMPPELFMVGVPVTQIAAALAVRMFPRRWGISSVPAAVCLLLALAAVVSCGLNTYDGSGTPAGEWLRWVGHAPVNLAMLLLTSFLGLVVVHFSCRYLGGDNGQARYRCWLHATLAAVTLAVISEHALVFLGACIGISLCLHQLLMFYPERPRAALAAHKKFIAARLAEFSLLIALIILHVHFGTWQIHRMQPTAGDAHGSLTVAAVFIALAALIKCAQLPLHGWLIQVVEAPTPVSALLHAGVINLGGYLLILFAPLLAASTAAQWLILTVAGLTATLAGLVMMTRVSIKVRLAWSTTAQMGLMLVECALGLFQLALLHLLAHSCYKAYAFLTSGSAVEADLQRRLVSPGLPDPAKWVVFVLTTAGGAMLWALYTNKLVSPLFLLLLAIGLLLIERRSGFAAWDWLRRAGAAFALAAVYLFEMKFFAELVSPLRMSAGKAAEIWVIGLLAGFGLVFGILRYHATTSWARSLILYLYAGLYLDEWSTRLTLLLWPLSSPRSFDSGNRLTVTGKQA
jgi:NAD(P)H-quinone oxidoreductase subunit 5